MEQYVVSEVDAAESVRANGGHFANGGRAQDFSHIRCAGADAGGVSNLWGDDSTVRCSGCNSARSVQRSHHGFGQPGGFSCRAELGGTVSAPGRVRVARRAFRHYQGVVVAGADRAGFLGSGLRHLACPLGLARGCAGNSGGPLHHPAAGDEISDSEMPIYATISGGGRRPRRASHEGSGRVCCGLRKEGVVGGPELLMEIVTV